MNSPLLNIILAVFVVVVPSFNALAVHSNPAHADENEFRYRFRHLDDTDGLPYTWVWNIFQDSSGYIWLSTMYGTYRYDGYSFIDYAFGDSSSGTPYSVYQVVEDNRGDMWFATERGLYRQNPDNNEYRLYNGSGLSPLRLSADAIECIAVDRDNNIWAGSTNGLNRVDADRKKCTVIAQPAESARSVKSVLCREDGSVWYGDYGGVVWRVDSLQQSASPVLRTGPYIITCLFENSDGLWVASAGDGLYLVTPTGISHFGVAEGTLRSDIVRAVAADADGNVWAATEKGIAVLSGDNAEFIVRHDNDTWGLNDNAIYSLLCDRDGTMWAGSFFNGVNMMNPRYGLFSSLKSGSGLDELRGAVVSSISAIGDRIYIGSENRGLYEYNPSTSTFTNYNSRNSSLSNDNVHSVCADSKGNLWIGNYYGGLSVLDKESKRLTRQPLFPSNSIYSILNDRRGNIWIGTFYDGLYRYNSATGEFERHARELAGTFVWGMIEDYLGNIWLACYGRGIVKLDRSENYSPKFIDTPVRRYVTLCQLSDGRILAGTEKEGLTAVGISDLSVKHFNSLNGLPDNTIYGICQDDSGNIWFSSNSGIYKTDLEFSRFSNYTVRDGLPANRFNYNAVAAIGGKIWFGSISGLVEVDPAREGNVTIEHPIVLGDLYINNIRQPVGACNPAGPEVLPKSLDTLDRLVFHSNLLSWGIDFSCNAFDSNAISYVYMLKGIDSRWHMLGSRNRVDFTGLGFGKYTLMISTVGPDGEPSANVRTLQIEIVPPWWRSTFAFVIYTLLILSFLAYLIYLLMKIARSRNDIKLERLEREKDKEINEMKFRFFVNISHEFKTPLSLIIGPIRDLLDGNIAEQAREKYFIVVKRNAEKLLALVNELLAFRELEHTKLHIQPLYYRPLLEQLVHRFSWIFESRNIKVELSTYDSSPIIWADFDKLEKVIGNLLSNAGKYTPIGGTVSIVVEHHDRRVYTSVTNSGPGIEPDRLPHIFERFFTSRSYDRYSSGVGLSYVKSLINLHEGDITVESVPGEFTTFTFWLPDRTDGKEVEPVDLSSHYAADSFDEPRTLSAPPAEINGDTMQELARKTTVLVVDDDQDFNDLLSDYLSNHFHTLKASSADEAMAIIKGGDVDIVVCDVMLGDGLNGIELCNSIKENVETDHIRVILASVFSENIYRSRGYEAGADIYIVKPFDFSILALRIRNLIYTSWKAREKYKTDIDLTAEAPLPNDVRNDWLRKATACVLENIADSAFNGDELCRAMNMSQSTLYRKLKATTGQSTNEFIQNLRLKYAARLLRETSLTVSEISFEIGFSDSSYFSRAFRKCFGESPRQWREKNRPSSV